ncbi:pyruvate kinase, partial [bacterium]|nr:pyruvate kinase [bacterium]
MNFKRTKIIATIGPASNTAKVLKNLMDKGVDVFRINSSHSSLEDAKQTALMIKQCRKQMKKNAGILLDLQGPKIRTGKLKNKKEIFLKQNNTIKITAENIEGTDEIISIPNKSVFYSLTKGDIILLADGMLALEVIEKDEYVTCRVVSSGPLGECKGVNLPKKTLPISALTERDIAYVQLAIELKVEYIALSFVRHAEDVAQLKAMIERPSNETKVIAKIEKPQAVEDIDNIIEMSDGIMVARGDLGVEVSLEKIPLIQKKLIELAHNKCKTVIVATQMMESMINNWKPTRAEVTDVANAVLDGTDCCMLSGETAVGKYPVETVDMMRSILQEVELSDPHLDQIDSWHDSAGDFTHALAESTCILAKETNAKAILAFTMSGNTALHVSKHRPSTIIFGLSPDEYSVNRMSLYWGVYPMIITIYQSIAEMIEQGKKILLEKKLLSKGDRIVVIAGTTPTP